MRECTDNRLFSPSFDHLTTAPALRNACIAGPRLLHACNTTPREGRNSLIPHTKTGLNILEVGQDDRDSTEDGEVDLYTFACSTARPVKDVILVPGGRYLLIMFTEQLTMWDLASIPEPRLCLREDLSGVGKAVYPRALEVWVQKNTMQLLVKVQLRVSR